MPTDEHGEGTTREEIDRESVPDNPCNTCGGPSGRTVYEISEGDEWECASCGVTLHAE